MIEKKELNRIACLGNDGRSLTAVRFQYFEISETKKGLRRHPGASCIELTSGEGVRQLDNEYFEVIATGEIIRATSGADYASTSGSARDDIPLCHYEELAQQENHMWEARRKASLPDDPADHAASNSSAGPKNS